MAQENYIEITNLSFAYPQQVRQVLHHIDLTIDKGDFVLLMGSSGSGKSTLLRQLKPKIAPVGQLSGDIKVAGKSIQAWSDKEQAQKIGVVLQNPENQIVTDKVWHELAFSMENLGFPQQQIRARVAEMASFFGIQEWFHQSVSELSGGQKQKLALASVMTLNPEILLLDEPTSQLDPIAANDFFRMIEKIHRELGVTIIMIEHNVSDVLAMANRLVIMDEGTVKSTQSVAQGIQALKQDNHRLFWNLPVPTQVWWCVAQDEEMPLTVETGRRWLATLDISTLAQANPKPIHLETLPTTPAVTLKDVWFKYKQTSDYVLKGVSATIPKGSIFTIVGGNGTGKSTLISVLAQTASHERGAITIDGEKIENIDKKTLYGQKLAVLPQNPRVLFTQKTVQLELDDMVRITDKVTPKAVADTIALCGLEHLLTQHPFDLSGGEQQRVALAKLLLLNPDILLLDEPTKGFDGLFKQQFADVLKTLKAVGKTIICVSHDLEFVADVADTCALFFDGNIVSLSDTRTFFSQNQFYTTSGNLMVRHLSPMLITGREIVEAMGEPFMTFQTSPQQEINENSPPTYQEQPPQPSQSVTSSWTTTKTVLFAVALLGFMLLTFYTSKNIDGLLAFLSGGQEANQLLDYPDELLRYAMVLAGYMTCISLFFILMAKRPQKVYQFSPLLTQSPHFKWYRLFSFILIMGTIVWGIYHIKTRQYYIVTNLVLLEIFIPYVVFFEKRKWQTRQLVIISTLIALAVASRIAFFMLPQFKPMLAVVIIAGVTLGSEVGFITGAMSALISNMYFGQGPWTVWQMFAFAFIGWLAGVLYQKNLLSTHRVALAVYGGISALVIYGTLLNLSTVVTVQNQITGGMVVAAMLQGLPFDLIHAVATIFFLLVGADSLVEKIGRVREKYNI